MTDAGWESAWRALAEKELKGEPIARDRHDGLAIDPVLGPDASRDEGLPTAARARSLVVVTDRSADAALAAGTDGVWWRSAEPPPPGVRVVVTERPPSAPVIDFADEGIVMLTPAHERGASPVTEVAMGVAWLASAAEVGDPLRVAVCVGPDLFVEIAKLRALRRLAHRVLAAMGAAESRIWIAARSADRSLARLDVPTNAIRTTIGCAAAMIGGADVIGVLPMDASARAARLARNTTAILAREAHLLSLDDAVRGSFAIEALTDRIARAAWERAREIDEHGSRVAMAWIERDAAARRAAVADGRLPIVGVSKYAVAGERCVAPDADDPRDAAPLEAMR